MFHFIDNPMSPDAFFILILIVIAAVSALIFWSIHLLSNPRIEIETFDTEAGGKPFLFGCSNCHSAFAVKQPFDIDNVVCPYCGNAEK